MRKLSKKNKTILLIALVVAMLIPLAFTLKPHSNADGRTKEVHPVFGSIRLTISTTGTVQPQNRLEIKPPISGRIEKILVREGDRVRNGQTIASMSSTERAALLDAAQAKGPEAVQYWEEVYRPTPLLAPIGGEVIVRAVEPGQTVTANDVVLVLSDRLIVKAQVDETDIGKVKRKQPARISLDAYPQILVHAVVDHISYESKIVNNVTMYEVDILPQRVPGVFRSGMSANVDIIEETKNNVLLLPREAVQQGAEGSFVLIRGAKNGKIVRQPIERGIADEESIEILSGLTTEDRIVIKTAIAPARKRSGKSSPFLPFGRKKK